MSAAPARLTPEFIASATLAFFPASAGEARYIQSRLFALGARWVNIGTEFFSPDACVASGMLVRKGVMYTFSDNSTLQAIVCDVRNLSDSLDAPDVSVHRRLDALEGSIAQLRAALTPQVVLKPQKGPAP